jgi:hypothetical protein
MIAAGSQGAPHIVADLRDVDADTDRSTGSRHPHRTDGMKVYPFFNTDLNRFKAGPARGHDMLTN